MQEEKRYRAAAIIDLAALEWNINCLLYTSVMTDILTLFP